MISSNLLTRPPGVDTEPTSTENPPERSQGGEYFMPVDVKLKKGESVDRAMRRLKKKLDKEGTMRELRNRAHYEKPSERKRKKSARARARMGRPSS
jgi:small subunit ribosomal protein S21